MASFFEVSEQTINTWKQQFPQFLESLKAGKIMADAMVANKLYQRAIGYKHDDVNVSNYQGKITLTPIKKVYAPDPTSMIFWLKNRNQANWRDKPDPSDGTFSFSRIQSLTFETQKVSDAVSFYPNPVTELLMVKGVVAGKVQLMDNTGKVVFNSDNIPASGIYMGNLSAGVYLVRIAHSSGSVTIKKIVRY